ncbi:sulfatase [Cyclobacterium marinum]|uniref:Sulfatase n=1 Tax=Cyclobacterium marinum (strain ATCC 25205 / DSM 745 / LMG 13164 / NCIMB 1802) TaxID=880070 RepID=G0IYC9_CYCMS|nr:sulfatase [Cyclobacterium marinum]AEL25664.1 sulfatase [Cyclobacterium marinum DSM 745]MBI0401093.1 sulfatase [Cyclobacterium marinum]
MNNPKTLLSIFHLLLLSFHSNLSAQERPPNIVYILIDDLGWKDLGCYGSEFYETPNIDKLRDQGMKFTAAYSASPVCSPSRASILTGKNPANIGFTGHITAIGKHRYPEEGRIIPPDDYMHVSLEEKMIPEILLQSGYTSASIGKWHVGEEEKFFPTHQGFAINIAGYEHGSPPTYWGPFESEKSWNPVIKNLDNREEGQYLTNRLTDEAINFIDENKEGPFFLYLSHYAVHTPLEAPDSLIKKYELKLEGQMEQKNAIYAAMIENMDWNVGRLLKSLDSLGLEGNTIVILGSDNGGEGRVTNNVPLREGKGYIYEGGIRVPLVIKWPGKVKPNSSSDVPVITDDMLPTIVEMAGLSNENQDIDGVSLLPLLTGEGGWGRDRLCWYYPHYSPQAKMPGYAIRMGDYKLVEYYDPPSVELFDLAKDIGETNDLSGVDVQKVEEMKASFKEWLMDFNPILHTENPNYNPNNRSN